MGAAVWYWNVHFLKCSVAPIRPPTPLTLLSPRHSPATPPPPKNWDGCNPRYCLPVRVTREPFCPQRKVTAPLMSWAQGWSNTITRTAQLPVANSMKSFRQERVGAVHSSLRLKVLTSHGPKQRERRREGRREERDVAHSATSPPRQPLEDQRQRIASIYSAALQTGVSEHTEDLPRRPLINLHRKILLCRFFPKTRSGLFHPAAGSFCLLYPPDLPSRLCPSAAGFSSLCLQTV